MVEALVAFGGNVGDARGAIRQAIAQYCDSETVTLLARSADYRTPPWGVTDQPHFVNACILVRTELPPRALLQRGHAVERAMGRDRSAERRYGPRVIDIDLLTYGHVSETNPDLTLPHPRLTERAFVLVPLAEIAGEHVVNGRRIKEWLADVDAAGIQRLS